LSRNLDILTGQYLNEVLQKNGLSREKLYLTGVVKEPTPGNRKPTAKEIKRWMPLPGG